MEGVDATTTELYTRAKFERAAWDTASTRYKAKMADITVPFFDYGLGVEISLKMMLKDANFVVEQILATVVPAYNSLNRQMAMEALTVMGGTNPRDPGYWRAGAGLTPYPNGLLQFPANDTHYMFEALGMQTVNRLTKKVRDKGYAKQGIVVVANESTWTAYKNLYDKDELSRIILLEELTGNGFTIDPNAKNYVQLSDADFPTGYFLCYDVNTKGLYKKIPEQAALRGLVRQFSSMESLEVNQSADFKVYETGYGVVERGFGAVMFVGAYDAATASFPVAPVAYVNPNFDLPIL